MSELKTLIPYFRPYRGALALGLILVVMANGFQSLGPLIMKLAIDTLDDPGLSARGMAGYAGLIVATALLGGAARYGMRELLNGVSRRVECDLRNDFFSHLLRMDAAFYGERRTGDLMARASNDTLAVRQAAGPAIMYTMNTITGFTVAISFMLWISPRLTLFVIVPMAVLPPVMIFFGKIIHRRFEAIQEQFSALSTMVQENLTGARIIRAYVQESSQAERFDELNRENMRRNMDLIKAAGLLHPILGILTGSAMVAVLWFGGLEVMAGRITIGDYVAFGIYLMLLIWPMIALGWVVNIFQRGAASMGRLNAILSIEPTVVSPQLPSGIASVRGKIEFRNVSFRYPGTERLVLEDVSFTAEPGQTVALVGPTGSGKTTVVSLLPRLYDPSGGVVLLDGVPLQEYDPAALRSIIGMVPQDSFLFSETIRDNIALGVEEGFPSERIEAAAGVAQLHESITNFPKGYDTILGERGVNLSGGQKQRATLARAVVRDPIVIILDDSLSAVDTHTEARILEDLGSVLKGRTSFIISHRVSAVMNADQILVLEHGRIVERGTHTELVRLGGTYEGLLRRQLLEEEVEGAGVEH